MWEAGSICGWHCCIEAVTFASTKPAEETNLQRSSSQRLFVIGLVDVSLWAYGRPASRDFELYFSVTVVEISVQL